MNKPIIRKPPHCRKCERPMFWVSEQTVESKGDSEMMQVYECISCGRFAAFPELAPPPKLARIALR